MNLANIQGKLSRSELKNIMACSDTAPGAMMAPTAITNKLLASLQVIQVKHIAMALEFMIGNVAVKKI